MRRFFDAHVYVANWMTAVFKVRVPIGSVSEKTADLRLSSKNSFSAGVEYEGICEHLQNC
jgi:hypothetical protein